MKNQWIISPLWDCLTLLSGATLCVVMVALKPFHLSDGMLLVLVASQRLMALTHSWSTTYLVIGSKLFKPIREARRVLFVGVPLLIFLGSLLLGILIAKTADLTDDGRFHSGSALLYIYIGLFMIGHFWHFGRQDYGVLTLYRQKTQQFGKRDRRLDQWYVQTVMFIVQPFIYVSIFTRRPLTNVFQFVISEGTINAVAATGAAIALIFYVGISIFEICKSNRSFPKLIYYAVIVFHPLFLYFSKLGLNPYWYISYLWSHWIVATTLAMRINSRFQISKGVSIWRAFANHAAIIVSISLFVVLFTRAFKDYSFFDKDFWEIYEAIRTLPPENYTLIGLILGFFLGEQLVHYYCDRWLYRFKDPQVRQAVAPHIF